MYLPAADPALVHAKDVELERICRPNPRAPCPSKIGQASSTRKYAVASVRRKGKRERRGSISNYNSSKNLYT
jgi:hypothetical protein